MSRPAARPPRPAPQYAATVSGWAVGFLPLPVAVVGYLMYAAVSSVQAGSVRLLWVLLAAVPGALLLGPLNCRRTLLAVGDPLATRTARLSAAFGLLGLGLMVLPFGLLVELGWLGLVADLALVAVTVPSMARQTALARHADERRAARIRQAREGPSRAARRPRGPVRRG